MVTARQFDVNVLEHVDWRMVAQDRGPWRRVVHLAAETCSHPYP